MRWFSYRPYVSVAKRQASARKEVARLAKKGQVISPVKLPGRTIAATFWGKAWCQNLEAYSDYGSRLPRGRSYVRNGSVVDLQIEPGAHAIKRCGDVFAQAGPVGAGAGHFDVRRSWKQPGRLIGHDAHHLLGYLSFEQFDHRRDLPRAILAHALPDGRMQRLDGDFDVIQLRPAHH